VGAILGVLFGGAWGSGINTGGLARQTRYLILLAQNKVSEQKGTSRHGPTGFPVLLAKPGGGLNSRYALRQRPPKAPVLAALLGVAQGKVGDVSLIGENFKDALLNSVSPHVYVRFISSEIRGGPVWLDRMFHVLSESPCDSV
jgi:hypothetical protein